MPLPVLTVKTTAITSPWNSDKYVLRKLQVKEQKQFEDFKNEKVPAHQLRLYGKIISECILEPKDLVIESKTSSEVEFCLFHILKFSGHDLPFTLVRAEGNLKDVEVKLEATIGCTFRHATLDDLAFLTSQNLKTESDITRGLLAKTLVSSYNQDTVYKAGKDFSFKEVFEWIGTIDLDVQRDVLLTKIAAEAPKLVFEVNGQEVIGLFNVMSLIAQEKKD